MVLKKRVLLAVLIVSLVLLAGCPVPETVSRESLLLEPVCKESVVPEPMPKEPAQEITTVFSEIKNGLKLELSIPRTSYRPGEMLSATLTLINTTPETISFYTACSRLFGLIIKGDAVPGELSSSTVSLPTVVHYPMPPGGRAPQVLSFQIMLAAPGEFYLMGDTVSLNLFPTRDESRLTERTERQRGDVIWGHPPDMFERPVETIRLKTPPLKVRVAGEGEPVRAGIDLENLDRGLLEGLPRDERIARLRAHASKTQQPVIEFLEKHGAEVHATLWIANTMTTTLDPDLIRVLFEEFEQIENVRPRCLYFLTPWGIFHEIRQITRPEPPQPPTVEE